MTTEDPVTIKLRSQPGIWLLVSLALGLLGLFALGLGVGTSVADGFGAAERLLLGLGCSVGGILLMLGAFVGLGVARASPELRVLPDRFTLDHSGLLRGPLTVARSDIQEVSVGEFSQGRPSGPAVMASSELLPDFSTPIASSGRQPNVLIVFRRELDLAKVPRRGLAAIAFVADRFSAYSGPSRGTLVSGLLGEADDTAQARRAFGPWGVLVDEPSEGARSRIGADEARRRMNRR